MIVARRLLFFLLFCSLPLAAAPAVFVPPPAIVAAGELGALRGGDFNGDMEPDFVLLAGGELAVYLGNGDGTFGLPIEGDIEAGSTLQVANVNGDGDLDVVIGYNANTSSVYDVYLGNGDGSFTAGATYSMPIDNPSENGFALADVTADGIVDIVGCGARYFAGAGNGTFGALTGSGSCAVEPEGVYVLNADGDAYGDVLIATRNGGVLHRNNGNGTFTASAYSAINAVNVAIADFDGNGLDDITWIDRLWHARSTIFAAAGGVYGARVTSGVSSVTGTPIAADFDGDALPDVAAADLEGHLQVWITAPGGAAEAGAIYMAGNESSELVTGDFDADGDLDMLTAGRRGRSSVSPTGVSVLANNGDGTFDAMNAYRLPPATYFLAPHGVALSDVTGDSIPDAVTLSTGVLAVLPGAAGGTFGTPIYTTIPSGLHRPFYGHWNGDGKVDVGFTGVTTGTFECWTSDGDGTFTKTAQVPTGALAAERVTGDFNGDGNLDFAQFLTDSAELYPGNGDGTFGARVTTSLPSLSPVGPAVGDFDGDGRDDVLTGTAILLGSAAGTFTKRNLASPVIATLVADLDADGNLDAVTGGGEGIEKAVLVALGNGDGTFDRAKRIDISSLASHETGAAAADFDGDGNLDVAFGTTVLLGDGTGSFDGYARFPYHGDSAIAVGDVDGNGSPDLITAAGEAIGVIRTGTTESLALPLTVVLEELPEETKRVGEYVRVGAEVLGETSFAATGAVIFKAGGVVGAFAEPLDGDASSLMRLNAAGNLTIGAAFGGDVLYAHADAAETVQFTVGKGTLTSTFTTSPSSPTVADAVHAVGSLMNGGGDGPELTGNVTISLDGAPQSTGPAAGFDVNLGLLPLGQHTIALQYGGDANYLPYETTRSLVVSDTPIPSGPASLHLITPCRILDTRGPSAPTGGPSLAAAATRTIPVAGLCGIPSGAAAVAMNLTVVAPQNVGFLTVYAGASPRPETSTLNYRTGKTRANSAIMPLSAAGRLNIFNSGPAATHVLIDVTGYFQ